MPYEFSYKAGSDDKTTGTPQGLNVFSSGQIFLQYGAGTAIASTVTETSLVSTATSLTSTSPVAAGFGPFFPADNSSVRVPANGHTLGTIWRQKIVGLMTNTGTPTLRIRAGFVNDASTFTVASDSTAVTMSTITGTMDFEVEVEYIIRSLTGSNNVACRQNIWYNTAIGTRVAITTATSTSTVDLTVNQNFDVRLTWGTSSASNSATVQYGYLGFVG